MPHFRAPVNTPESKQGTGCRKNTSVYLKSFKQPDEHVHPRRPAIHLGKEKGSALYDNSLSILSLSDHNDHNGQQENMQIE
jgi:hypothetical protein